ncbi:DUF1801 domain-containing protein [Pleomorphovibrio marinus]|uniref:DUF1801 domain-containing protein n=1 Tax=Pleomorphovibrio marinus TaxID=2164132 RepID=UPI000E0C0A20|nr:DUF1801 domain-containing protein [Pleomorphovibrio marinus]
MATNKTKPTERDVHEFIKEFVDSEKKRNDSLELLSLFTKLTGQEPKMWGESIIGFGHYHYKYASGHEGDAPLVGFSPRKSAISLYVFTGLEEHFHLVENLGKFKMGKACIYIKKLEDIDIQKLGLLVQTTIHYLEEKYGKQHSS